MNRLHRRALSAAPASRFFSVFIFLAVTLIVGWLLVTFKFIFLPMLLALFAAFLFSPPVEWLYRRGLPRPLGIIFTLGLAILLCFLAGSYVSASFMAFHDGFPKYEERIEELLSQAKTVSDHFPFVTEERVRSAVRSISLSGLVGGALNSVFTILRFIPK